MFKLRPFQRQALDVLQHHPSHLICVAPTGSGKSLIYEHHLQKNVERCLLITPLVALSRQQASALRDLGLSTGLGTRPHSEPPPQPSKNKSAIWIVSPEKLFHPYRKQIHALLKAWKPSFLVVDECHCLFEWGSDFRPAYQNIPELIREYSINRSLWLTATLPFHARKRLKSKLSESNATSLHEIGTFRLPQNLRISIARVPYLEKLSYLVDFVSNQNQPGLIYVSSRKATHQLEGLIRKAIRKKTGFYHAGLSFEERQAIEKQLLDRTLDLIVCTSAFGMGMNFTQLRWAVLHHVPPTLLTLTQIIGRVTRGSEWGEARINWNPTDFQVVEWITQGKLSRQRELQAVYQFLAQNQCKAVQLEAYFEGKPAQTQCNQCSACLTSST